MKLLRYGPRGQEKPGLLDAEGRIRDLSGRVADLAGDVLSPAGLARLRELDPAGLPLVEGKPRLGPCVGVIPKIVAVGLNYPDPATLPRWWHWVRRVAVGLVNPPHKPVLFMKATSAITGPHDDVMIPKGSVKTDWEVELGIVIGSVTRYVSAHESMAHVAGYCVVNDVSEREYQIERSGQWDKGKSCDTFAPIGPWLVTADEVPDPQNLDVFLDVNGVRRQAGNTRTMIFGVAHLVSYISHFMTLMPGDVIPTGTPPGVGMCMKPPTYLKPGDEVRLGIAGLGEQRQRFVAFS
jgi:2-keto-4-pentenoate hydratase/2-oxohepta-3-ene-1,7-dioic acid hydratase in catechol pathway